MLENVVSVTLETLLGDTAKIKYEGCKFITLSCVELDTSNIDILYHFDHDFQLTHFRLTVTKDSVVPSISHIIPAAFLAENEIQDLFNVTFSNLSIDFKRTLFLENGIKSGPMCRYSVVNPTPDITI